MSELINSQPLIEGVPDDQLREDVENFEKALHHYQTRQFELARQTISALNKKNQLPLYELYLKRIDEYTKTPPPDNWDGAFVFRRK